MSGMGAPFASFSLSGTDWLWPAVALLAFTAIGLVWSYRAAPPGARRGLCILLKLLGVAALALCLLEPLWSAPHARRGANLFALVADNSQSLQVKDGGGSASRCERLRGLLSGLGNAWQRPIEDQFEVRRFLFDARLQTTRDFADLTFEGRVTGLGAALRGVTERYAGQPLAGVLLFTDGNATDLAGGELPPGLPPIYPVVLGQPGAARDVAVDQVNVSQTVFEDAPVTVQASVNAVGLPGQNITAQLLDAGGRKVAEQTLRARKESDALAFRFQLRPERAGVSFYRLRAGLKTEMDGADGAAPVATQEATQVNNQRVVAVDRGHGPHRILYVSGRPNWEFKFLNRAVQADDQLQLVALVRIALREPKFEFRGRAGETGNPLFRGFGDQSREEVARYDQPVLVRLNTRDELELRGGFPRTPEDLFGYEAVIIDDLEAGFFAPDQAALLARYVAERGGGLLMLGGVDTFQHGGYHRTPIGDLLPVYLDKVDERKATHWKYSLAREGWLQSWARVRDTEEAEKSRREGMPPFQVFNRVRAVKPGASVVATATEDNGTEYPALVTQRFGRGRSAALLVGDVWRWGMRDADARQDMEKAWRQLMRWLVADTPAPVELAVEPSPDPPAGAVRFQVRARDAKFQPLDDATVALEIRGSLLDSTNSVTNVVRLRAEPAAAEPGLYEATFVPRVNGGYQVTASVTNVTGVAVGTAATGWSTDLGADEFRSLQPNVALLESIAKRTGGEVVSADRLAEFARNLPLRQAPVMEASTRPLWHTPWWFAFALTCFVLEWGLRRWKGLP